MDKINEALGYEMRNQRLLKRMTLEQVGEKMGRARNSISLLELGVTKITVVDLKKYCEAVGCSWIEVIHAAEKRSQE